MARPGGARRAGRVRRGRAGGVGRLDGPCGAAARAVLALEGAAAAALGRATARALGLAAEVVGSADAIQGAASEALQAWALR